MTIYYQDGTVRLFHGDCLEILDWLEADALITDPPYGMGLSSRRGGSFGESRIAGDEDTASRDAAMGLWGDRPALVFGRWSEPRPVGTTAHGADLGEGGARWHGRPKPPWKPNTAEEIYVIGSGFTDAEMARSSSTSPSPGR